MTFVNDFSLCLSLANNLRKYCAYKSGMKKKLEFVGTNTQTNDQLVGYIMQLDSAKVRMCASHNSQTAYAY